MKLMRLDDVPAGERDRIFRYSPARALLVAITLLCGTAGLILLGWHRRAILAYYIAGVLILGLIVMRRFIRARLRSSNWLARMSGEGLFVQFRSYLNYHFPQDDFPVVFIPYSEIRSVRLMRERRDIPDRDDTQTVGTVSQQRRRLLEFQLLWGVLTRSGWEQYRSVLPRHVTQKIIAFYLYVGSVKVYF